MLVIQSLYVDYGTLRLMLSLRPWLETFTWYNSRDVRRTSIDAIVWYHMLDHFNHVSPPGPISPLFTTNCQFDMQKITRFHEPTSRIIFISVRPNSKSRIHTITVLALFQNLIRTKPNVEIALKLTYNNPNEGNCIPDIDRNSKLKKI